MSDLEPVEGAAPRRGLVGRVVADRYRVVRVVSAGANTVIADAADLVADRPVTLKLVRPELAESADFRRDFDAAMASVSSLTHPNLAVVHEWGEEVIGQRTTVYVVVEYLGGGSLRDLFDRGRTLSPSQALMVGLEACRGLDVAHRQGLVHTELSPAKLVFGDDRRLRVVDFGLAPLVGRPAWRDPANVATHVARYSSPEQALGQPVTGATDVYSLALILSEAVSGSVPFSGHSTVATLSARIGRLMPVSADLGPLAAVLERAGRPDPADRYTAAEFGRALVRAAEQLPRPAPLPIVLPGPFADDPDRLRRPNDPTGGLARPPDADVAAPLVAPSEPPAAGDAAPADLPADPLPPPTVGTGDPADDVPPQLYDGDEDLTIDELAALANEPPADPPLVAVAPAVVPPLAAPPVAASAPPPERVPERPRRRWLALLAALLILAAGGALAVVAVRLFQAPTHEVPALAGMTEQAAQAAIAEFDWDVEVERERSDEEPDAGQVVRTAPSVGESLGEGEPFLMVVSDGPELRALPELDGETLTAAQTELARLRLDALAPTDAFDEEVPEGSVISWSVPDDPSLAVGDEVLPDTEVALVVSAGPKPRRIPELIGVSVADSRAFLEGLRLRMRLAEPVFSDDIPRRAVVRIRPEVGARVERGSVVTLVPSKGPDLVTMPDLEGLNVNQARRALQRVELRFGRLLGSTRGHFVSASVDGESVEAGDRIKRGTRVDAVFL